MNMGSASSVVENNASSSGGYNAGYFNNGIAVGSNFTVANAVGAAEELPLIKVDYDMQPQGYSSWSGDAVQGQNAGVFTMWND